MQVPWFITHQPQQQSSNFMPSHDPLQHFLQPPQDSECTVGGGVFETIWRELTLRDHNLC